MLQESSSAFLIFTDRKKRRQAKYREQFCVRELSAKKEREGGYQSDARVPGLSFVEVAWMAGMVRRYLDLLFCL